MWLNSSFIRCWVPFGNVLCCKSRAFMSGEQKSVFSFKELRGSRTCPPATTTLAVYRCCGSVFTTVGLTVFVVCNEPQLVPESRRNHFRVVSSQSHLPPDTSVLCGTSLHSWLRLLLCACQHIYSSQKYIGGMY